MKEIRRINKVVSPEPGSDRSEYSETEIKEILGIFESEPGYFKQVIRPMLLPGHENELVFWLRETGLIKSTRRCVNAGVENCSFMSWVSARGLDIYQWRCNACFYRKSIREDSLFNNVKCSFKNAIRIILGFCKGTDIDTMAAMLSVKKAVIGQLYKRTAAVAEKYIRANQIEWKIGGPGRIVLVDTYPDIVGNSRQRRGRRMILCLSEAQTIPQKYWLEILGNRTCMPIKTQIRKAIMEVVHPGTILIVPSESRYCSYENISNLKDSYPVIITTSDLEKHNNEHQNLLDNLQTIWKSILNVCEEAQYYGSEYIQEYIIGQMWRRRYNNTSFEMLVYQIGV